MRGGEIAGDDELISISEDKQTAMRSEGLFLFLYSKEVEYKYLESARLSVPVPVIHAQSARETLTLFLPFPVS